MRLVRLAAHRDHTNSIYLVRREGRGLPQSLWPELGNLPIRSRLSDKTPIQSGGQEFLRESRALPQHQSLQHTVPSNLLNSDPASVPELHGISPANT